MSSILIKKAMEFTKPENLTKEQLHQDVTEHFRENKVVHPITNKDSTYIQNGMSGVGIIFYNNKIRVQGAANIFNPLVFCIYFCWCFCCYFTHQQHFVWITNRFGYCNICSANSPETGQRIGRKSEAISGAKI